MPGVDLGLRRRAVRGVRELRRRILDRPAVHPQPADRRAEHARASPPAIQAALDRTAPGYGGDQPETDIEALYQIATGRRLRRQQQRHDHRQRRGRAGRRRSSRPATAATCPSFGSFTVDPAGNVLPAAGTVGGAGFRPARCRSSSPPPTPASPSSRAGETSVTGVGGADAARSPRSRRRRARTTPFNSGAGIQQTITALNALGALVIGLGTNGDATVDPRQGLEALAKLTGAVNRSADHDPQRHARPDRARRPALLPDQLRLRRQRRQRHRHRDPERRRRTSSVNLDAQGVRPARAHRRRRRRRSTTSAPGETATFDVTFTGDGRPHRFDLQFVRAGHRRRARLDPRRHRHADRRRRLRVRRARGRRDPASTTTSATRTTRPCRSTSRRASRRAPTSPSPQRTPARRPSPAGRRRSAPGPRGEADQVVDFLVTNNNNGLFSVQPTLLPGRHAHVHPGRRRDRDGHRHGPPARQRRHRRRRRGHQRRRRPSPSPSAPAGAARRRSRGDTSSTTAVPSTGTPLAMDAADDGAIAPDKVALLPGQTPGVANVTGYSRGINGVMIDVAGLPAAAVLTPADFAFEALDASGALVVGRRRAGSAGGQRPEGRGRRRVGPRHPHLGRQCGAQRLAPRHAAGDAADGFGRARRRSPSATSPATPATARQPSASTPWTSAA